jgi:hypothetical protein
MLAIRPNCERCDVDLPPACEDARICTYECTFCAGCVDGVLHNVCPNCGGGFAPRPIRPQLAWREGAGFGSHPADTKRGRLGYSDAETSQFVNSLRDTPPEER